MQILVLVLVTVLQAPEYIPRYHIHGVSEARPKFQETMDEDQNLQSQRRRSPFQERQLH